MTLLIDIGNTAIKWGIFNQQNVVILGHERYQDILPEQIILKSWQALPKPEKVLISNVAANSIGEQIRILVKKCWDINAIFILENQSLPKIKPLLTQGILGVDRWLALLVIRQVEEIPFAVIGCGTAITLDVCQNGAHLGGLITPGIELMRLSLEKHTAGCRLKSDRSDSDTLIAFDTDGAIRAGTLTMAATFIETTLEKIEKRLNLSLKTFITGGDSERLMPLFCHPTRFIETPFLVLNGLVLFD